MQRLVRVQRQVDQLLGQRASRWLGAACRICEAELTISLRVSACEAPAPAPSEACDWREMRGGGGASGSAVRVLSTAATTTYPPRPWSSGGCGGSGAGSAGLAQRGRGRIR